MPLQVLATPFPVQFPADASWVAEDDGSALLGPVPLMGETDIELWASVFIPAQLWHLETFEEGTSR